MRVQQLTARSDEGAVALLVAIVALVLLAMAAFAVDLGNAYANKRQLSVAADASALAAARAVNAAIPVGGTCNEVALEPTARTAATTANAQNDQRSDSIVSSVSVACSASGTVQVTVTNQRTLPSFFGGVFGVGEYTPAGQATAELFVPGGASGLRPIAACEATVRANYNPSSSPPIANAFLVNVSNSSAVCGAGAPGQWGFTNFLDQGVYGDFETPSDPAYNPDPDVCDPVPGSATAGGGANCQRDWVRDGYGGPVYFPNAVAGPGTGLAGNTGLSNRADYRAAFDALVDKTIQLPVASQYVGGRLNITGVVSVVVCSANRGGTVVQGTSTTCAGRRVPTVDPDLNTWLNYKMNEGGLWVVPVSYATSGVIDPRAGCRVGQSSCDFGTRAVRLFK